MIPSIVHFVWTTPEKHFSALNDRCITSWLKFNRQYEIRIWHDLFESNYLYSGCKFSNDIPPVCKEVLTQDRVHWVLKSDVLRFLAVYLQGGIYADTDMECLRSMDIFLTDKSFAGESYPLNNIGNAIFGAEQGNILMLDIAKTTAEIIMDNISDANKPHPQWTVDRQGLMLQEVQRIYAKEFFYPVGWDNKEGNYNKDAAYTFHHWTGTLKDGWTKDTY